MSGFRDAWVRGAAIASLLLPLYFLIAAFGTKYGLFNWALGFQVLTLQVGPVLALLALTAGVVGLAMAGIVRPLRGWQLSLLAMFIPAVALLIVGGAYVQSQNAPPIHDVSTDLVDPPRFSPTIEAERAMIRGSNSLDLKHARAPDDPHLGLAAGRLSSDLQKAAFPDVQPIAVGVPKARALAAARGAAGALGWKIDSVDDHATWLTAERIRWCRYPGRNVRFAASRIFRSAPSR